MLGEGRYADRGMRRLHQGDAKGSGRGEEVRGEVKACTGHGQNMRLLNRCVWCCSGFGGGCGGGGDDSDVVK